MHEQQQHLEPWLVCLLLFFELETVHFFFSGDMIFKSVKVTVLQKSFSFGLGEMRQQIQQDRLFVHGPRLFKVFIFEKRFTLWYSKQKLLA